jgi:hypothetical protein
VITGDRDWLLLALKHALRNNERAFPIYTRLDPDTDRVYPWGRWVIPYMYLGGQVLSDHASLPYPHHAITWEQTGTDFAALVTGTGAERLTLRVFDFNDEPRSVVIRPWRLNPGRYQMTVSRKTDAGWQRISTAQKRVKGRGQRISLGLKPNALIRARLIKEGK